jgi:hypothetical protein
MFFSSSATELRTSLLKRSFIDIRANQSFKYRIAHRLLGRKMEPWYDRAGVRDRASQDEAGWRSALSALNQDRSWLRSQCPALFVLAGPPGLFDPAEVHGLE